MASSSYHMVDLYRDCSGTTLLPPLNVCEVGEGAEVVAWDPGLGGRVSLIGWE